jgi:hypothetical protein
MLKTSKSREGGSEVERRRVTTGSRLGPNGAEKTTVIRQAVTAAHDGGPLWYERDQLATRIGVAPADRPAALEARPDLVRQRDDLSVELAVSLRQR